MYERPQTLRMMEIDPEAPGFFGLIRGERGPAWQQFVITAAGALALIISLGIAQFV